MKVVLGVSGGIAAYKACELLRLFTESGHEVRVVPTREALNFVGAPTWAALSGNPVSAEVWDDVHQVPHVRIGKSADLVVVAPATADLLAKAAHGLAGDLLTNTLLTATCPVVFAPAMHTEMWQHPATRANVATLRERGAIVLDPAVGRLTGADTGPGRLPDPAEIFQVCLRVLRGRPRDLAGRRVVVSAGGTREAIDPVRFLGNRSTGLQGYALARTAAARGAEVTLVAANVALPDPAGATVVRVESAAQLREAVLAASEGADVVVMAAAVADFRPADRHDIKIKKTDGEPEPIRLTKNPDILAELGELRRAAREAAGHPEAGRAPVVHAAAGPATAGPAAAGPAAAGPAADGPAPGRPAADGRVAMGPAVIVGFAAETHDVLANGQAKLARKGCDLLVVNQVGEGRAFGTPDNAATVLVAGGEPVEVPLGPKDDVADAVWDLVAVRLP
ncbi:bifunctional phosphopantothenoylcysteine decarboxylase/phosphopantothenate--cysteine ligase CoaBC [Nonomuraea sp. LP-02]|uniref:bifunctional phosphopantothenoylcysteine decarboxylase/phosphopantothenate--cysteine ligase CoaBC n=1 Tax=Nonomuraea sp. LP-02 TaxID=3097960 RepID=UPI002E33B3B3|nr:bifunctional phosphopantothenoylcysteine decarboxylase/phosphopantothenate--cysteine ligase CoaBC [Nonomuraea sp. LP-02]MED7925493.1 bifunctional phosphopantothenoylcysteine decarboxylase/phosphopantothenate--cysteine ligase CoaBC [Nonomuraea sp. LP-02]